MSQRVCVIGGGVLGLSCARSLAALGVEGVTVLEQGHVGQGSTSLAVGMVLRVQESALGQQISQRSYDLWEQLEAEGKVVLRRTGHISPVYSTEGQAHVERLARLQESMGRVPFRIVPLEDLKQWAPDYVPPTTAIAAVWDEHAMYVDGAEAAGALATDCREAGVEVRTGTGLVGVEAGSGARFSVTTTKGVVEADILVNAAGAWGAKVGDILGAPVDVLNERHEAYIFRIQGDHGPLPMMLDVLPGTSSEEGLYFRGEGDRHVIAGLHSSHLLGGLTEDPDSYSRRWTEADMEKVFGMLTEALPHVDLGFESAWAGLYPHHPNDYFVLGPHPADPHIFVGAGLGGRGLGPGPALGEILAEWIGLGSPRTIPEARGLAPTD
jgi:glycine/D-amino acid oxidase-like deaminating enzyme